MAKKQETNKGEIRSGRPVRTRGRTFVGLVIKAKTPKTATIEWSSTRKIPKYERFEKTRTRIHAHNPTEISAKEGDRVLVQECRPLSKTKKSIIIKKLGTDLAEAKQREEMMEEKRAVDKKKQRKSKEEAEADESN